MTQWHVLAPAVDGGWNSIDYDDDFTTANRMARYWHRQGCRTLALAKGASGDALEWVVYYRTAEEPGDIYVSAHRTLLGAKRAYLKVGRTKPEAVEYGFRKVGAY